ncbi:MAG: hypothetical protein HY922_04080 [Elusimicrobia bacterium]|nr:hypothetical protein [Elusimicrobiota bacterium]
MPNPELVTYIRQHLKTFGEAAIREQLLADGIAQEEVDLAFAAIIKPRKGPYVKGKLAIFAVCAGVILIAVAVFIGLEKPPSPEEIAAQAAASRPPTSAPADDSGVFKGHYGYMLKLPTGYQAAGGFDDPMKTHEVAHLYPSGTSPTHFIHEGLYGQLGILRIEAAPRRRPQGMVGIETLKAIALSRLKLERATYTSRVIFVNGLPAFIVSTTQPFAQVKAYLVGQKVYYIVTAGEDNDLFNNILQTFVEAAPHDTPGR